MHPSAQRACYISTKFMILAPGKPQLACGSDRNTFQHEVFYELIVLGIHNMILACDRHTLLFLR